MGKEREGREGEGKCKERKERRESRDGCKEKDVFFFRL
jgi:hypothetical protein